MNRVENQLVSLAACPLPKALDLTQANKVLVFAPHPDDETLGCGGTLAQLAKLCPVKVVLVTDGSGAGGLQPGAGEVRQAEFVRALAVLGITDSMQLGQPDGNFQSNQKLETQVQALLADYQPDWVFLPSPLDYHRDHVRIAAFLEPLCRQSSSVTQLLFYEIWAPVPATHVVDITDHVQLKKMALFEHATAMPHGDYERAMDGLNRYRGLYLGRNRMAEAFWVESAKEGNLFQPMQAMALHLLSRLSHPESLPLHPVKPQDRDVATVGSKNRENNRFDILRLLAAWLVLFTHCYALGGRPQNEPLASTWGIDSLGGVGVSIFFVLSGYLVTMSVERSPNLIEFFRRRALRIYPALIVICLLSVLALGPQLTTLSLTDYWANSITWDYLKNATAFLIQYPLPGVFTDNPAPSAINGSLWSLPYELTCYAALALLSLVPGAMRAKALIALISIAGLILLRPTVPPANPFTNFFGLDYYHTKLGLMFALGAVFACWRDHLRVLLWPSLILLFVSYYTTHSSMQLLLFLLGLGVLTLWLALYARWLPRVPSRIGDWSYGAYLYGFPVQQLLAHYKLHEVSFAGYVIVSTFVTFTLAGLSWHLVVKQALRWK